jgi:hypothetical protein
MLTPWRRTISNFFNRKSTLSSFLHTLHLHTNVVFFWMINYGKLKFVHCPNNMFKYTNNMFKNTNVLKEITY